MTNTTKTALITGASRGLGLALAQALAAANWHLILTARGAEALLSAETNLSSHTTVTALAGDIADPQHRENLRMAAESAGGLDLIVNNAGMLGPSPQPKLLDYPLDSLLDVFRVNVVAQLGILQAVAAALKPNSAILNLTSDAAVEAYAGWGGYGASKAAFEQLSAVFSAENPQLRVYWVDPGDMRTDMHQAAFPGEDISDRDLPELSLPGLLTLIDGTLPSGRYRAKQMPVLF